VHLNDEGKMPFKSKNEIVDSLNDFSWLRELIFLADVTKKFNTLNLEFQGSDNCVANIINEINVLKSRLLLGKSKWDNKNR
jgi:hypothetical protein